MRKRVNDLRDVGSRFEDIRGNFDGDGDGDGDGVSANSAAPRTPLALSTLKTITINFCNNNFKL